MKEADKYKVRVFNFSDKCYASFTCPICKMEDIIDKDQYEGKVSIDCPKCKFHETLNLAR